MVDYIYTACAINNFMNAEILLDLGLIILFANVLGEITRRMKMSPLVGQITTGLIAGPVLGIVHPNEVLEVFSFLGIMILAFLIGMETKFQDLQKDIYLGSFLAISGALLTFIAGFIIGDLVFGDIKTGIVVGVAMISTSTAIPLKILIDRGQYHTRMGKVFAIMAIADDVIAILSLSLLVAFFSGAGISFYRVSYLFFAILGFIFLIYAVGDKLINGFVNTFTIMRDENIFLAIPMAIVFIVASISESIGLAAISGAFLAGMALSRSELKDSLIIPKINILGYGFIIPVFFAYSAVFIDIPTIFTHYNVVMIILLAGVIAKAIGSGYMARLGGFDARAQRIFAVGMIPRGEYGIVISQVALTRGLISSEIYTILISFIVLTVILAPILFSLESRI